MSRRKVSAGLLMFRGSVTRLEVFLVHPGGPYFARRDAGVWSLPKGEIEGGEPPLSVAFREFEEETGQTVESCATGKALYDLGSIVQPGGKTVHAWAFPGDWPSGAIFVSNTFELEWPPRSGRFEEVPEVDRGEFFAVREARRRINTGQAPLLDRLLRALAGSEP